MRAPVLLSLALLGCSEDKFQTCAESNSCEVAGPVGGDGDSETGGNGGSVSDGSGGGETTEACGECAAPTPGCNDAEECVECTSDTHCEGATSLCDVSAEVCVGCLGNVDCTDADASVCDGGSCSACVEDADCSHVTGKGICDAGACVECTATDERACGANSCDPVTNTCTDTARGSVRTCLSCVANSECEPDFDCVPTFFQGSAAGAVCLKRFSTGCAKPFANETETRSSLSAPSVGQTYCGFDEEVTTCAAILGIDDSCVVATDCGNGSGDDARCETVGGIVDSCTFSCLLDRDCPGSLECDGPSVSDLWCGGAP